MITITKTDELAAYCARAAAAPYVTVDTEFLRERTYYSQLCLAQMAIPGPEKDAAVLIDPLADGISLEPLYDLMRDERVVKVFHAARQDVEILLIDGDAIPRPLFDTQVAAMVCGFGEQVGYETLVRKIAKAQLDKSSRFTDWSRRPLSEAQMTYALADVTHLRVIYEFLVAEIDKSGRRAWVDEELAALADPELYIVRPEAAWQRIKTRTNSRRFLAIVRELARFREQYAQSRNVPRSKVIKDEALLEIASTKPRSIQEMSRSRLLQREARKGELADGLIAAIAAGVDCAAEDLPDIPKRNGAMQVDPALADMLRVLLKAKSENCGVAPRMIASAAELDQIAAGNRDVLSLTGWRAGVFGEDALRLCNGEVGLAARGGRIEVVDLDGN